MATYDFTPKANSTVDLPSVGGNNTVGTLETTGAVAMYKITVKNDSNTAVDLQGVDGAHGSAYDLILREVAPLMAWAPAAADGIIHVVVDSHANSAATLQARVRAIMESTAGANDSTVEAAASFAVSV
jgi:hypothetical protein